MERSAIWRVGVYIDVQNLYLTTKAVHQVGRINYRVLRDHFQAPGREVFLVAFTCYDPENKGQQDFMNFLGLSGFRVVSKPIRRLPDGSVKASMDLEMAIEVLTAAPHLDEVVLMTGDGDFVPLVQQLALMGRKVTIVGPDRMTAPDLIRACHEFCSLTEIDGVLEFGEE